MFNRNLIFLLVFISVAIIPPAYAQLPQISNGLNYLTTTQSSSGTWDSGTAQVETTATTVSVLETYKLLNQTGSTSYTTGVSWLQTQSPKPVEYVAERLRVLSLVDVTSILSEIDAIKKAWGGSGGFKINPLDTAIALQTLKGANYNDPAIINPALAYLTTSQNADGGWGLYGGDNSNIYMTAIVSATLQQFPQMAVIANAVSKATAFLIAHQNSDGGFGTSSTAYETALAFIALVGDGQTQGLPLQNAVAYLTATQSANGSWNDDPYSTALALKALYLSENKPAPPPAPPAGGTITGTIIDAATKKPLSGVQVALDGNNLFTATTDATGGFTLAGVPPGAQNVSFTLSGYAAKSATATAAEGTTVNLGTISLVSAYSTGTIAGTVTDPAGKPVAGVAIAVTGAWSGSATTGADGSYSFTYVTPGEVTINVNKAGYQSVTSASTVYARTTLTFSPRLSTTPPTATTGTLIGRVVDSYWGVPIGHLPEETGVQVIVSGGTPVPVEPEGGGYFTIANLQPGTYQVVVGMHGFASHTFRVVITAGNTTDLGTIKLEGGFAMTLAGKVTDATTGIAIPGAEIVVNPGNLTSRTDVAGTYAIADINDPLITVKVSAPGYVDKSYTIGAKPWLQTMDVALIPQVTKGEITGTVVDALTTLPLPGVALSLVSDPQVTTLTDSAGKFTLSGVLQGWQQIAVNLDGYTPRTLKTFITAGATTRAGTIAISTGAYPASVQGVVRNLGSGEPFAGVAVEATTGETRMTATTAADGTYTITGLTPGDLIVSAIAGRYFDARIRSTIAAGETLIFSPALAMMITPSADMTVKVDKAPYKRGETVPVAVNIHNKQSLDLSPLLYVKVVDPYGVKVFDTAVSLALASDGNAAQSVSFVMPPEAPAGQYLIQAGLYDEAGNIIQTASADFGSAVSEIAITPTLPATFSTATTVSFNLTNTGAIAVSSGVLAVTLKDPDGQVAYTSSQAFSLALAESKMLTYSITTGALKLGTYTLSYTLSDETRTVKPVEVALPNTVAIKAAFDKDSYRVRDAASLTVVLTNTGKFNLDTGFTATMSVPDAAYTETKSVPAGISASGTAVIYSFPVPDTVIAGLHAATVTVHFPSGSEITEKAFWAVPESSLTSTVVKTAYSVGDTITSVITNTGGVDTPVNYKASLYDAKSTLIAEKSATNTAVAGSSISFDLPIPFGAVDGAYTLTVQCKDGKTSVEKIIPYALSITGVKASLQLHTDKDVYLATENIAGLGTVTNTSTILRGGNAHLQVVTGPGSYRQKTWTTQADFQTGVRNGVDTYGVNDWIIPDDDFEGTAIDRNKWTVGSNVSIQSGKLLVDTTQAISSSTLQSKWLLDGDFDIQVDFSANNSGDWVGAQLYVSVNGSYVSIGNYKAPGYYSQAVVDGVLQSNGSAGSSTTSGTFRITRSGSRVDVYYWGGASWTAVNTCTSPILAAPATVGLTIWRGPGYPGATTAFDNFKVNSGRIKTENQTVDSVRLLPLNDNFDDGVLNEDRWPVVNGPKPSEDSGVVHLIHTAANSSNYLAHRVSMTGDFSAVSAYKNHSVSPAQTTGGRYIMQGDTGVGHIYINRCSQDLSRGGGEFLVSLSAVNDSWQMTSDVPYNSGSGQFRLRREGTTAFTDYWNGTSWVTQHSRPSFPSAPAGLRLFTLSEINLPTVKTDIERFYTNKGTYADNGTTSLKFDSLKAGTGWGQLLFNTSQPIGTTIKFRTRTADTEAGLATAIWSNYITTSGSPIASPAARWIEVEATLATTDTNITPLLNDLTVTYLADPGEVLWQTDVPVELAPAAISDLNKTTIGILGVAGKLYFQGTVTSSTGQTVATAEYPFYIEQGNFQMALTPDKKIYKPGETVTITGETRNLTSVAASGLTLQIKDAAGVTVYIETYDLPANGSWPFSFTKVAGADGTYTLKGTLTQNGATIADVFDQYEVASPVVSATVTAPDSSGTDPFQISLALTNSGKAPAIVTIGKSFDSRAETITIPAGETGSLQYSQQITADTTYTFTITGDLNQTLAKTVAYVAPPLSTTATITTKVTTDKVAYNPNDQATLTSTLTASSYMDNLSLLVTVTNSQGQAIYTDTATIAQLNQGQMTTVKKYWNVGTTAPGTYLVTLQTLNSAGAVIAKTTCNLVIAVATTPTALFKGQITLDKQSILTGEPVTVSYTVTNVGNIDLASVGLSVQTINVSDQTVVNTFASQTGLVMGATYYGNGTIDTQNYTAKDYLVVLRATIDGIEETLGGTFFRVEGAPSAPALVGPAAGTDVATFTPQLTVSNAADPNDDRLTYQFEVYTDSALTNLATSGVAPETTGMTSWTTTVSLTENQTYYWRARAYDGKLYGPWMTPASFRVNTVNDVPTAPTIATTTDGSAVATLTPTLTVNNASDPDSTSLIYNFDVALDTGFTTIVASTTGVAPGTATTSWTVPTALQENQWYYWRAQADDWQMDGPWSATGRFQVNTSNDAPTTPVITAPATGSTVAALKINVVLTNSTDPDSPTIGYVFEADTVPTFDSPNVIRSGSVTQGDGSTTWNLTGLTDNTRYYIRAKASDGAAESAWSDVVTFFANTVNDPPTTPIPANPSDGAGVNQFSPTLSVHNATDLDMDTLTYEFEVYTDAALTTLVTQAAGVAETAASTSWTLPVTLTENQTYYWRARASDGALVSTWSQTQSFMVNTANDAPGAPTVVAPATGATIATLTPTLTVANASDPDSDSLTYDFEIYAGTTLVAAKSGIPGDAGGNTSWTPAQTLADNTLYQWRARAYDGDRYGEWMPMATFTTHLPVTAITAEIEFEPETLNQKSEGKWITVEIELPHGYKASDIDLTSIRLEGTVPAETRPYQIHRGHHDDDSLKVKFSRSAVIAVLPEGGHVPVHVTGRVGAVQFEGMDVIRVIKSNNPDSDHSD